MKKTTNLLLGAIILLSLTQCETPVSDVALRNPETRSSLISSLISNEMYMTELMDSMKSMHPEELMSTVYILMQEKPQMGMDMMDNMMEMCQTDSSISKRMMTKTMEMCSSDESKCNMMSDAMMNHQPAMKCMMDNMKKKSMNKIGAPEKNAKPTDHLQHH
ncbi:MAG TPA: hypothetical protein PKH65_02790 [Bacteroidia bacterium]|nr:hypothetical protein [Bacteroidia bacterium]